MKPYLVFAGDAYYPGGGAIDFREAFATREEAEEWLRKNKAARENPEWERHYDWAQVAYFDGEKLAILTDDNNPGWP